MRQSVESLENFYSSQLGQTAQAMVLRKLHTLWPHFDDMDALGYGYGIPYLDSYRGRNYRLIHAMPAGQGAVAHMGRRGNRSVLVEAAHLPFAPASFDRVLVAHGLEEAPDLSAVLTELWRIMKPEGRIVIVAANRAGLWARSDNTPFGAGRPFSRTQLSKSLRSAGFVPLVRSGALYCPPTRLLTGPRSSRVLEVFGETVCPGLSGLVLVEAVKRLYTGRIVKEHKRVYRPNFSGVLGATKIRAHKEILETYD